MDWRTRALLRPIDWFLSDALRTGSADQLRRARLLVAMSVLGSLAMIGGAVAGSARGTPELIRAVYLLAALQLLIPFVVKRSRSLFWVGNGFLTMVFVVLAGMILATGGRSTGPLIVAATLPLSAVLLNGVRSGVVWGVVVSAFVAGVAVAVGRGIDFPLHPDPEYVATWTMRAAILTTAYLLAVAVAYEWLRDLALQDATEARSLTEAAHRDRQAGEVRFRALIEQSADAISIVTADSRLVYQSPAAIEMSGSKEPSLGITIFRRMHPDDRAGSVDAFERCAAQPGAIIKRRCRFRQVDGTWRHYEGTARNLLDDPAVRGIVLNYRDVTDRVRAEEERQRLDARMVRAEKLESLGVLAGGIAHDFNNLLVGILGNAELAREVVGPESRVFPMIGDIQEASERAADLVRQLLAYAGKGRLTTEDVDLARLVRQTAQLLHGHFGPGARLILEEPIGEPWVRADATQLRQVVMNLITNAAESLSGGEGEVRVRTGTFVARADYLAECMGAAGLSPGTYAYVEVADDGAGMDGATFEKIFEPFFSTKFEGRGLGLAATLGIVAAHSGALRVHSELAAGTTFRVLFPACKPRPQATVHPSTAAASESASVGTVLLVDDEAAVRNVARRMLEGAGFRVVEAENGAEAEKSICEHAVTAVLLDWTMPGMDGEATFHALRRVRPDVPIVFMSGHSEMDMRNRLRGMARVGRLQKPFRLEELKGALQETIAGTAESPKDAETPGGERSLRPQS